MKTFYDCVIHPRETDEWSDESCPTGKNDCDNCEHRKYIGTLGGEFYVECDYEYTEEDD